MYAYTIERKMKRKKKKIKINKITKWLQKMKKKEDRANDRRTQLKLMLTSVSCFKQRIICI